MLLVASIAACSPEVVYQNVQFPPPNAAQDKDYLAQIRKAAEERSQVFALPVSRIIVLAPSKDDEPKSKTEPSTVGRSTLQTSKAGLETAGAKDGNGGVNSQSEKEKSGIKSGDGDTSAPETSLGGGYKAQIVPAESGRFYRIKGVTGFWSDTNVQITKLPNSDIPTGVAIDFTDYTPTRIQQAVSILASIAVAASGFAQGENKKKCDKPTALQDFAIRLEESLLDGTDKEIPDQPCWKVIFDKMNITGAPDVLPIKFMDQLAAQSDQPKVTFFPVPACRDLNVRIVEQVLPSQQNALAHEYKAIVRIVDPSFIRLASLPAKGQIAMHSVCGADISNSPVDPYKAYFEAGSNFFDKMKSVDDAFKGSGNSTGDKKASDDGTSANTGDDTAGDQK
jgi:hypothetical protein